MNHLNQLGLSSVIKDKVKEGTPLFGICLGLQMLFTESEEFGKSKGLDIIKGRIEKFPMEHKSNHLKIPQIGWNKITMYNEDLWNASSLSGIKDGTFMYFVHSFYAKPDNDTEVLTNTNYCGFEYCSAVYNKKNVFATQFHPEKSGENGLKIYKQWAKNYNLLQ
jgi:glutamine amidotransferase